MYIHAIQCIFLSDSDRTNGVPTLSLRTLVSAHSIVLERVSNGYHMASRQGVIYVVY